MALKNNVRRNREHGVIDDISRRTVGMDPVLARQVIRDVEDLAWPLRESSLEPPVCHIRVGEKPIAPLTHGLGVNWPAVAQGAEAYPREDDEAGWENVFAGMRDAGIRWVRFWLDPLTPLERQDLAHAPGLGRLDRLQRWAVQNDAEILLELCRIPAEYMHSSLHDAPGDLDFYVRDYVLPLIRHIVRERRCDRISLLCLFNEPFNADVSPYIFYPPPGQDPLEYYLQMHEILRAALDADGLDSIGLIGPNTANLFQRHIEMFEDRGWGARVQRTFAELDGHMWRMRFDYHPPSKRWPGYPFSEGIERYLLPTLAAARRMGKRLSLTETGAMYFNENPCTARNTHHDAFLTIAEGTVRAINAGVSGVLIWSFLNSGRVDGQWGWLKTRDAGFARSPHLFNGYTVLMRPHRPGAQILPCAVSRSDFSTFIQAAALSVPGMGETIWIINDHPVENIRVEIQRPGAPEGSPLQVMRKGVDPAVRILEPVQNARCLSLILPGMSLTALSSLPGVMPS